MTRSHLASSLVAFAALVAVALGGFACTRPPPPEPVAPLTTARPLQLSPIANLVAAAGLRWIVDLRPRALFADAALIPSLCEVLPEAELDAMTRARGGIDLRSADDLVMAGFPGSTLFAVHQVLEPGKVEAAFGERVAEVLGRATDRSGDDPRTVMTRVWGAVGTRHEALVVFGHEAAALAIGGDAPLRAAELFADQRLKRARPAWQATPLDRVGELLGEAPVRAAAPGPFEGEWTAGVGGVLAAATGVGIAAKVAGEAAHVTIVVTGSWGDRVGEAEERFKRCYETLVGSGLGRLLGAHQPAVPPVFSTSPDSLRVEVDLHVQPLIRGIGDATTTELEAIMKRPMTSGAAGGAPNP